MCTAYVPASVHTHSLHRVLRSQALPDTQCHHSLPAKWRPVVATKADEARALTPRGSSRTLEVQRRAAIMRSETSTLAFCVQVQIARGVCRCQRQEAAELCAPLRIQPLQPCMTYERHTWPKPSLGGVTSHAAASVAATMYELSYAAAVARRRHCNRSQLPLQSRPKATRTPPKLAKANGQVASASHTKPKQASAQPSRSCILACIRDQHVHGEADTAPLPP